jgi:hypothetical protein
VKSGVKSTRKTTTKALHFCPCLGFNPAPQVQDKPETPAHITLALPLPIMNRDILIPSNEGSCGGFVGFYQVHGRMSRASSNGLEPSAEDAGVKIQRLMTGIEFCRPMSVGGWNGVGPVHCWAA